MRKEEFTRLEIAVVVIFMIIADFLILSAVGVDITDPSIGGPNNEQLHGPGLIKYGRVGLPTPNIYAITGSCGGDHLAVRVNSAIYVLHN